MHTFWDWVEYNNAKRIHEGIVRNVKERLACKIQGIGGKQNKWKGRNCPQ